LREQCNRVVHYAIDDNYGSRDGRRFSAFRAAVPEYDLLVVVREPNIEEARRFGARRVMRVHFSADEVAHAPLALTADDNGRWAAQVLFLGTWMPERGRLMAQLMQLGVPLIIRGNRWERAPEWPALRHAWRGPGIVGRDYAAALQSATVCLGLVSKKNRDLH